MTPVHEVELGTATLERFRSVLTDEQWQRLLRAAERGRKDFEGRVIWNVNSTARGGGVAELLASLVPYSRAAGVDVRWLVIDGDPAFFQITKRLHNMLHGAPGDGQGLSEPDRTVYRATSERNAAELVELVGPDDLVLLHDPQTAGLIEPLRARGTRVVWRCHVGVDVPNDLVRAAWAFLLPHVTAADRVVFSRAAFVWEGLDRSRVEVIPPSIDAFTPKNQPLAPGAIEAILRASRMHAGPTDGVATFARLDGTPGRVVRGVERNGSPPLPATAPAVVQVSRWDGLKDPRGVLRAYAESVAPVTDAHLVLAGPDTAAVADDPEGPAVLAEITAYAERLSPELRARVHLFSLPMDDLQENAIMVNALQRRADVVVQKSLAEGFGLTVAEAMWKARPVVASAVGGVQDQIVDGESGLLVDPEDLDGFARAVTGLLADPGRAEWMGHNARERVRGAFLGARHLEQYVELFEGIVS
ncbi:MAG TPA: glycosyltransferase [Thermoleophilaceae bacterium]|nr:glycosyltransferase [Thermoleophilaceae bacterium]